MTFPDDSVQAWATPWWVPETSKTVCRGHLLRAFLPHFDQVPFVLQATGRCQPTQHTNATYRVTALHPGAKAPPKTRGLPIAALPDFPNEVRIVQRAKTRPALVLSTGGTRLPKQSGPTWQTAPGLLVAPYFGVAKTDDRAGWPATFVDRIRIGEYPQYIWDHLPGNGEDSILRLDQTQPLGDHHVAYELLPYRLADPAMAIVDEWFRWLVTGILENGELNDIKGVLAGDIMANG